MLPSMVRYCCASRTASALCLLPCAAPKHGEQRADTCRLAHLCAKQNALPPAWPLQNGVAHLAGVMHPLVQFLVSWRCCRACNKWNLSPSWVADHEGVVLAGNPIAVDRPWLPRRSFCTFIRVLFCQGNAHGALGGLGELGCIRRVGAADVVLLLRWERVAMGALIHGSLRPETRLSAIWQP